MAVFLASAESNYGGGGGGGGGPQAHDILRSTGRPQLEITQGAVGPQPLLAVPVTAALRARLYKR